MARGRGLATVVLAIGWLWLLPAQARTSQPPAAQLDLLGRAGDKAREVLLRNVAPEGILAGGQYRDNWARDTAFATPGLLAMGQSAAVRTSLETFLGQLSKRDLHWLPRALQRNLVREGQAPLRVGADRLQMTLRFLKLPEPLRRALVSEKRRPVYREDKEGHIPMDPNALVVITAHAYIKSTGDRSMLQRHLRDLERLVAWYQPFVDGRDGLVDHEARYANWADNMPKQGKVLYTNVCYARALSCLSELEALAGDAPRARDYRERFGRVKESINRSFWNGRYYDDWLKPAGRHLSTDGNVLAILWDIADPARSRQVLDSMDRAAVDSPVPCRATDRLLPRLPYSLSIRLGKMQDYHQSCWPWLGIASAAARAKVGQRQRALDELARVAGAVVRDGDFLELYDARTGAPYERQSPLGRYEAARGFTWSAGMYLWACQQLGVQ
jgi:glycogen debranching enzyme